MDRVGRETWAKRVERWNDSGLTAKEFAEELGISARSLRWWKWQLGLKAVPPSMKRRRRSRVDAPVPALAPASSLESKVTFVELPRAAIGSAAPIEIVLRSRVELRVAVGFDGPTLERVLEIMERRS